MPPTRSDEFPSITENAPLIAELRARIDRAGPMTFRDFMAAALYHPRFGYYTTHAAAMSRGGDYVTSPEVHQIFGVLVAKQIIEAWQAMGAPAAFDIVELGGGRGLLARDVITRAGREPALASALRYVIVETSPALRGAQQATLAAAGIDGVRWLDGLPAEIEGCVLSNEFFDALPVHRVRREGDRLSEVFVTHDGGRFVDVLAAPSTAELGAYFERIGVLPGEGCIAEVNLEAVRWMQDVASSLRRGVVLTFDYGYEAQDLYAPWRRDGTLLCFYRQSASSDPHARIGDQDITASVDFTSLRLAGEGGGLMTVGLTDQAAFLVRMGIGQALSSLTQERPDQLEEYFARRSVVLDLIDPGKLGRVRLLAQARDLPDVRLYGLADA
jgi:SAM-dependent MidA family methyltransferase